MAEQSIWDFAVVLRVIQIDNIADRRCCLLRISQRAVIFRWRGENKDDEEAN